MDSHNRFETPTTFRVARLEWLVGLTACTTLALMHLGDIRWAVFVGLFVVIDVIGYLPGAIMFRRHPDHEVPRAAYVLYNLMHNLVTAAVIVGGWALIFGPEWALLAVPIHLLGDRALFGNTLKPFGVSFEPKTHPAFVAFEAEYGRRRPAPARQEADSVVGS